MSESNRHSAYRTLARSSSLIVTLIGLAVLTFGWRLDMDVFRRPISAGDPMMANTAAFFGLLGIALWLRLDERRSSELRRLGTVLAVLVALGGVLTLAQDILGVDFGIDQILAEEMGGRTAPGRMAPNSALSFFLLGTAVASIDRLRRTSVTTTLLTLLIGFTAAAGYALGIDGLNGVTAFTVMAAHTALLFVLLSLATLFGRPEQEPIVRLTWSDSGGVIGRRLMPLFVVLFVALTWLIATLSGVTDGQIPPQAVLLDNVILSGFLLILTWLLAGVLHESEEKKRLTAEGLLKDKNQFMASVGHELRTPVTALVGFAELLSGMGRDLPEDERGQILQTMADQGADLVALLEDLMVAARQDTGSLSVARVRVNLRAQVAQAMESLGDNAPRLGELTDNEVFVEGDPLRVRQILRNLLTNAERYGGDDVRVIIAEVDGAGVIEVWDDGPGIPPESIASVFEAYVTSHGEQGRVGSVGLGLSVALQLAVRMGGDLAYYREGSWSVFRLILPEYVEAETHISPSLEAVPR